MSFGGAGITSNRQGGAQYSARDADSGSTVENAPARVGRSQEVVVTDAYIPASGRRRMLQLAPGDEADIRRGGKLGRSRGGDGAVLAATLEQTAELRGLRGDIQGLTQALLYRRHMDAIAGPAGRY